MNKINFYVTKFVYLNKDSDFVLDISLKNIKRKLSDFGKRVFYLFDECYSNKTDNIVFSSRFLEPDKLAQLIQQYKNNNEISPMVFSSSVYNGIIGLWAVQRKYDKNYSALCASKNTISNGLLTCLISKSQESEFVFADNFKDDFMGFGLSISFEKEKGAKKYCITLKEKAEDIEDIFNQFIDFFSGKIKILDCSMFKMEAVQND
ncbi:beta-ketoacyl synthase chain length factor [bacterium]|nr:beta-ketoacyl synthase chain length factor [bacterium]